MSFMSAITVVLTRAHGTWFADSTMREQVKAIAKAIKPATPKYLTSVDLIKVWVRIQQNDYTGIQGLKRLQVDVIILLRIAVAARSDDITKWDPRSELYCVLHDAAGEVVTSIHLAWSMTIRYRDPKDPIKNGVWSQEVSLYRIRPDVLVDPAVPHLATKAKVKQLDVFGKLELLQQRMKTKLSLTKPGSFFISVTESAGGAPLVLTAKTLAKYVMKRLALDNIITTTTEDGGAPEKSGKVGGHYLRGHAESVVYELAKDSESEANFDPYEMVARARHAVSTFHSNYHRPMVLRQKVAFTAHPNRRVLTVEEVQFL